MREILFFDQLFNNLLLVRGFCNRTLFGVYETVAQTTRNISDSHVGKSSLQKIANFGNYPGDYRHKSEDREIRFKTWSSVDSPVIIE